jgi:hypothetical protein
MGHRIFAMPFASVYPAYVAKAVRKGRTRAEVDEIIAWLTGYAGPGLQAVLDDKRDFGAFFRDAPALNPGRAAVRGVICGVRIEEIDDPLMREIRILDKLVDDLAKGRTLDRILRRGAG